MKKNEKLEISDEMIGTTDGKTRCTVFADPFIRKKKKKDVKLQPIRTKQHNRS